MQVQQYTQRRQQHWDDVARQSDKHYRMGRYYQRRLRELYRWVIQPGQRVLEIGCGDGDLLASVEPSFGVGLDVSGEMVQRAKTRHPELHILQGDAHHLPFEATFDAIILSDALNDLWDVQAMFEGLRDVCHPNTRIIINVYSRVWEIPLFLAQRLKLAKPNLPQNWLTPDDIDDLLYLSDFEIIKTWPDVLFPFGVPLVADVANRFLVKLWGFKTFALTHMIVARPTGLTQETAKPSVSVIVPARNEAGNIDNIFSRVPRMGSHTELIFVEGHSKDDTFTTIEQAIDNHPEWDARLFQQTGMGKGDAVRLGFEEAQNDILMILDADLTVPPEDLPRFYDVIASGKADFANGVRLVYPMEDEAMRFLNLLGNKFFSLAFTWLLGQPIKDSLCGTKVLYKSQYEFIAAGRSYFGDFDPFGDFDLLFGAAKNNLKIVDVPVRYRNRTYGDTNISRWKHGWLLLRMVVFAARRVKFI